MAWITKGNRGVLETIGEAVTIAVFECRAEDDRCPRETIVRVQVAVIDGRRDRFTQVQGGVGSGPPGINGFKTFESSVLCADDRSEALELEGNGLSAATSNVESLDEPVSR